MPDDVIKLNILKAFLRNYYYNHEAVKSSFAEIKDYMFTELKNSGYIADKSESANTVINNAKERSFQMFLARVLGEDAVALDEEGNQYLGNAKKLADDFMRGKGITIMGAGNDGMITLKGDKDKLNETLVFANRHKGKTPKIYNDENPITVGNTESADSVKPWAITDIRFHSEGRINEKVEKPKSGSIWNKIVKVFTGHPSAAWAPYERYQHQLVIDAAVTAAAMRKDNFDELKPENVERAKTSANREFFSKLAELQKKKAKEAAERANSEVETWSYESDVLDKKPQEGKQPIQEEQPQASVQEKPPLKEEEPQLNQNEQSAPQEIGKPDGVKVAPQEIKKDEDNQKSAAPSNKPLPAGAKKDNVSVNQMLNNGLADYAYAFKGDSLNKQNPHPINKCGHFQLKEKARVLSSAKMLTKLSALNLSLRGSDEFNKYKDKEGYSMPELLANAYVMSKLRDTFNERDDMHPSNFIPSETQLSVNDFSEFDKVLFKYDSFMKESVDYFKVNNIMEAADLSPAEMLFDPNKSFAKQVDSILQKTGKLEEFRKKAFGSEYDPKLDEFMITKADKVESKDGPALI